MNKSILIATVLAVLFFVAFAESRCYRTYYGLWKCYDAVDEQSDIRRNVAFSDIHSNREFADADIKFGKIFKKIGKIGLNLGKAYLRTQGIPLEDNKPVKASILPRRRNCWLPRPRRFPLIKSEVQSDKFFKSLGKLLKKAVPYLKAGVKEYVNNNFDEAADIKFGKIFKKIGKIGLNLGKAYLRTQGIPLNDDQADKFWKKLWGVVKQVGKGAIKSYVNQNFDAEADFKLGKLLKKVGKVGLKLGKAYLRTQGLPLEDNQEVTPRRISPRRRFSAKRRLIRRRVNVESDKFWKKLFKVVGQIGKGAIKSYVNQNFDAEADRLIRIGCC